MRSTHLEQERRFLPGSGHPRIVAKFDGDAVFLPVFVVFLLLPGVCQAKMILGPFLLLNSTNFNGDVPPGFSYTSQSKPGGGIIFDYYLKDDEQFVEGRELYRAYVQRLFELADLGQFGTVTE